MKSIHVTRKNLGEAVDLALRICTASLEQAQNKPLDEGLIRDLTSASNALRLIEKEMRLGEGRPRGQRSSAFTRYVLDEESRMVMEAELRDLVVKIEDEYARHY